MCGVYALTLFGKSSVVFNLFLSICMKGNTCTLLLFKFNMQSSLPKLGGAIIFTSWNVCGLLIADIHTKFQLSFFSHASSHIV